MNRSITTDLNLGRV